MNTFADFVESKAKAEAEANFSRYAKLTRKAADATAAKFAALFLELEAMRQLPGVMRSPAQVDGDIQLHRNHAELASLVDGIPQLRAEFDKYDAEFAAKKATAKAAVDAIWASLDKEPSLAKRNEIGVQLRQYDKDDVVDKLATMRQKEFRLLGLADPSKPDPRRCLWQGVFGPTTGLPAAALDFEQAESLAGVELVAYEGEDLKHRQYLLDLLAESKATGKAIMYIMSREDQEKVKPPYGLRVHSHDGPASYKYFNMDAFTWARPPGYSQAMVDEYLRKLRKRIKSENPAMFRELESAPQRSSPVSSYLERTKA